MSIPVRFDYMLSDGTIHENVGLFTMSYGTDIDDIPTQRKYIQRVLWDMLNDWKELIDKPSELDKRPWMSRDKCFIDARKFRMSGKEAWYEIWKEEK